MKLKFLSIVFFGFGLLLLFYLSFQPPTVKFSKDFYYDYESNSIFGRNELIDISPKIIDYKYDKKFVIVKQRPKYINDPMYDYPKDYKYTDGLKEDYYWLIILKEKKVLGPLKYEDFSELLKLNNVVLDFKNSYNAKL